MSLFRGRDRSATPATNSSHPASAADDLRPLKDAIDGLTYPSESDEPFDAFAWPGEGSAQAAVASHAGKGRKLAEVSVEQFFSQLDDSDDAERYRELRQKLLALLSNVQVFRVGEGEVRVDIYLIGKAPSGNWAGLHTVSIET